MLVQHPPRSQQVSFAFGGERHVHMAAFHTLGSNFPFQRPDGVGRCGLRDVVCLGGPGEVSAQRLGALSDVNPGGWKVTKGGPLFPREAPIAP